MGKLFERLKHQLIIAEAAQRVANDLYQRNMIEHDEIGEAEDDLLKNFTRGMDGFTLAKVLEANREWDCYAAMVAVLDRMEGYCDDVEREAAAAKAAA